MKNTELFFRDYDEYCFFKNPANGFGLFTKDEYDEYIHQCEMDEEVQAEIEAENAWLRKAESASIDDYGFERWEFERGL